MDHFWQELKLIDGPARWFYWAGGLISIWVYQKDNLNAGAVVGLLLYLGLNVVLVLLLPIVSLTWRRYLAVGVYIVDLLFVSLIIYHTGGLVSQMFLLYCFLIFKAAIYYPYIHIIIFVPFLIFPLYVITLYLNTGTIVFLQEQGFVSRYTLLLMIIFAGLYTAWHLDGRHRQTRDLLRQLEIEHRQIAERRRELRTVLDSIGDGVIVVNPELELLMINPVAADIFDLSYPQPSGESLTDLIDNSTLIALLLRALGDSGDTDGLIYDEIRTRPLSSGKSVVCGALATALISDQAMPHGAVVVLHDMTRSKELEESKTNFISMLSHELRTPLTAIRGFVDLILTGDAGDITPQQREFLQIAFDQSEHLGSLINALLEFAEMEASETSLEMYVVSPKKLAYTVLGHIEPLADQHDIKLLTHISSDLAPLYADGKRLERVLFNLLENAIKFTPRNGQVTVSIRDQEDETLFCVTDTGPGVPPAERVRIFERFYQIDNSSTREHGGTGLGLALCKHIVEMHHGRIWVEQPGEAAPDAQNKGSCFCFTIPRGMEPRIDLAAVAPIDEAT